MARSPHDKVRRVDAPVSRSRPVVTPIWPSVVYGSDDPDMLDAQYAGEVQGYTYAREGHPNADVLAAMIDRLEGAEGGIVTGSGMSALGAIYLGLLKAGDHIVAGDQLYGRNLRLMKEDLPRLGISVNLVDVGDANAVRAALRPETRLVLVEAVSNPTLRIADMRGIAALTRDTGTLLAVDNTFTTPAMFRPFEHGADIVMHSVTKLMAGHSDATLGYVVARDPALGAAMRTAAVTWGLTASPFDCWLAERGLQSFDLRFDRAAATAQALGDALAGLSGVAEVRYPARADHPDADRAGALFGESGGTMVSFRLEGGRDAANRFCRAAPKIPFAPTLGDVATTISHPATSSHRGLTVDERAALGITEGFFRVSLGIEDTDSICREITAAVKKAMA